jgi:hypothetical protein
MRTVEEALKHAEQQRGYPMRDSVHLIEDFIVLADEIQRNRSYTCNHPKRENYTAFISPEFAQNKFWTDRGMMFDDKTKVEGDPGVTDGKIHFPQPDGTCVTSYI